LRGWINWDPVGVDAREVNNEWVKIQNLSTTTALPLGGWWIRDSFYRRLTFRQGTVIQPGDTLTVYTGHGADTATSVHWNLNTPMFQNPGDRHHLGDGAYLFDPQGDLRLGVQYPCLVACSDPLEGAIELSVQPRDREYVLVRNVAGAAADLYGYQLLQPGYQYIFSPSSVLQPGETLRIYAAGNSSNNTRLVRYWGINGHPMFADRGGAVTLANFFGLTLTCDSWASGHC
jgi:hypothetical protein